MIHEAGHAFSFTVVTTNLHKNVIIQSNWREVASMSMELYKKYTDRILSKETTDRARKMHLEAIIGLLCGYAEIDAFHDGCT